MPVFRTELPANTAIMSRLVVNPDTPEAWLIQLQPGSISLGRSQKNDFAIEHPSVSSSHCRIIVSPTGVRLKDAGSTAGTFVNGELVEEAQLKPGQLIHLGEVVLRFESDVPESPPASTEPPLAPPIPRLEGRASTGFCKFHPQTPARFVCPKCARRFCQLCVDFRSGGSASRHFCRRCGAECQPLQVVQAQNKPAAPAGFISSLPRAFLYPLQGSGVLLLVAGTIFFFVLGLLPLVSLIATGYLFNYAKSIIVSTTQGRHELPDWPDLSDWKDDIVVPYLQLLALVVLTFGPSMLVLVWQSWHGTVLRTAYFSTLGFGLWLAPMGMLGLAMFDSVAVLNPLALTSTILRVPFQYLVAAAAFELVLVFHLYGEGVIRAAIHIPFVPRLVSGLLYFYLLAVGMRILGLLYLNYSDKFGWFSRSRKN